MEPTGTKQSYSRATARPVYQATVDPANFPSDPPRIGWLLKRLAVPENSETSSGKRLPLYSNCLASREKVGQKLPRMSERWNMLSLNLNPLSRCL